MRVVVTGGAGFIGSHLCTAPLDRGDAAVHAAGTVELGHEALGVDTDPGV